MEYAPLRRLLWQAIFATSLVFCVLQVWRPCFFLTDDNLSGGLPFFTEMGRHLLRGESPFYSDYIFGGHYNLLRDPTFFAWHPIVFPLSLLTATPLRFLTIDLYVFFFLQVSTCGFIVLADYLRRELDLVLSNSRIIFFCLSLHFSLYLLSVCSSWGGFMASQSALPWLVLGLLHRSTRMGVGLILIFTVNEVLGGHPEPTLSNGIMLSLFAAGLALSTRTWRPLWVWGIGNVSALLLLSPLLWMALGGFYHSKRAEGLSALHMTLYNVNPHFFLFSFFMGTASGMIRFAHQAHPMPVFSFSFFMANAAAWYLMSIVISRARWTALQALCIAMMIILGLLIARPLWISQIMIHVPLLKSMQWPFREIMQLLFFTHLLFLVRPPGGSLMLQRGCMAAGTAVFILPFFFTPKPTINPLEFDREILFNGEAQSYWNHVLALLKPGDQYIVIEDVDMCFASKIGPPGILLGSNDYPMLFKLPCASGYSPTAPRDQLSLKVVPVWTFGSFDPSQKADVLREKPDLKIITLESITPLKISLSSRDGPTVDLTSFLTPETRAHFEGSP